MLRRALIALTQRAERIELLNRLSQTAKAMLKLRRELPDMLEGMSALASATNAETATWITDADILAGKSGPFDVLDLTRHLAIAEIAGVPAVPARVILTLTEAEASMASGGIDLDGKRTRRIAQRLSRNLGAGAPPTAPDDGEAVDRDELLEKLAAAMDDVPEGWMVRHARCGGSNLKALAGFGVAGPEVPEVRFGPNLEVGPGWVRIGNRRMVDVTDMRTVSAIAEAPDGPTSFVARPWVKAARWRFGEDPHRHGTAFAGKGGWPCEWRAFIRDGKVVGVANYYGWLGQANPQEAQKALEVRDLAQRMADVMTRQGLLPRFMDHEMIRGNPEIAELLAPYGRDMVGCALDFIETDQGMMLLEGGPPHTAMGGGHCCAFAGTNGAPMQGNAMDVEGVAFRLLDDVVLADMATWEKGRRADRTGRILTWDEVEVLASKADGA